MWRQAYEVGLAEDDHEDSDDKDADAVGQVLDGRVGVGGAIRVLVNQHWLIRPSCPGFTLWLHQYITINSSQPNV